MITTTGQRTVSGCTVFADDADLLQFYAVPESPHIALDPQGNPIFSLVEYRRPLDQVSEADRATKLGGGLLTFSISLSRSADQDAAIRAALAADPGLQNALGIVQTDEVDYSDWWNNQINKDVSKLAAALKINALPVDSGNVAVAIDGEQGASAGEFVTTLVGAGKVSMTGDEGAAFTAKLTMDGAALLWSMIEKNLAAIWVGYQLNFTSRLDGVKMIAHCDVLSALHAAQTQWQHLSETGSFSDVTDGSTSTHSYDHASSNNASNVISKIASATGDTWVKVIPTAGPDVIKPDMIAQLTQQGWTLIGNFLSQTLLQSTNPADATTKDDPTLTTALVDGGGGRKYGGDAADTYTVKTIDETTTGDFNVTFDEKATVPTTLAPTANLSDILAGHDVKNFRAQIDLDPQFYKYADVEVSCTTDFNTEPVDLVKAHLEYHGGSGATRIDTVKDLVFAKGAMPQFFSTYLASPDEVSYSYAVDVFYRGSTQTYHLEGTSDDLQLVLDTDTLGIISVNVQVGIVDWTRFQAVQIDLSYGGSANGAHTTLILNSGKQTDTWVAVLGAAITQDYNYTVTWVDKNNQQIPQPAGHGRDRQLVINQPEHESLSVTLVPAGAFGTGGLLSKIVTALRYKDTVNNYEQSTTVTMASDDDNKTWDVPLINTQLRSYDYQVSVFYSDGLTRTDQEWVTTDKTVLAVGDPYGWRVQFLPYQLKFPAGKWSFATLHVSFTDSAGGISVEQDYSITDFTQPVTWRFRLAAPDRHTFTYQLNLFAVDPATPSVQGALMTDTKEVVVLLPPSTTA